MKVILAGLNRLTLLATIVLFNGALLQPPHAKEVDLDTLCQKFPLNSRCEGYSSSAPTQSAVTVDRVPQVIRLRLKTSGPDDEWIRIERNENTVKLVHTKRAKRGISGVFNGILGAVSPVPLPSINSHRWHDHPTTRIVFESDSCALSQRLIASTNLSQNDRSLHVSSCAIAGTDSVTLAQGTDIYQGRFIIEYSEENLLRSIAFRVPPLEL